MTNISLDERVICTEPSKCPFGKCIPEKCSNIIAHGWDFEYGTSSQEFAFKHCKKCGLVYLAELPTASEMNVIYPDNYYSFTESNSEKMLVKLVRDHLERSKGHVYQTLVKNKNPNVIDIGCGDGRLLDILKRQCPVSWTYSGIEFGGIASERAKLKGYNVREGDFGELDVVEWNDKFDLALMHQVIEHTRDPKAILIKSRGLLKKGGVLSIETPDTNAWDFMLFKNQYWGGYHFPRHFFLFNKKSMAKLALETGFEIISCRSILSPVFWIHSIHNKMIDSNRLKRFAHFVKPQNVVLLAIATIIDIIQVKIFRKSSNMQFLLRKV